MAETHAKVPATGAKITIVWRTPAGARPADRPLHRGRRHRPRHLAGQRARLRRRGGQGLRREAQDPVDGGPRRPEVVRQARQLAARRDGRGLPRVPGRHQGPPHHAHRRRHPLAQRGPAADARPLRLPAPGALVQGRALARPPPREGGHGDLPGEHRGHLRRHRVRGGSRGSEEGLGLPEGRVPRRVQEDPLPGDGRPRLQAGLPRGHRASGALRHRVRDRQQAQERDPRPQGQHHEVHRGRLPRLGLRPGRAGLRREDLHLGAVGAHEEGEGRGGRQRRAEGRPGRGPDPREGRHRRHHACSRCSPGPTTSTSSPP